MTVTQEPQALVLQEAPSPAPAPATQTRNPHAFTTQTAREMAQRSHQARRAKRLAAAEASKPAPEPVQPDSLDPRLFLVQEQIRLTREALNGKLDPKDRAQLVRALCGLLDRERILKGEPLPGSLKPTAAPSRRSILAPVVQPAPVLPATDDKQDAG